MNIIDTSSGRSSGKDCKESIINIPLFNTKGIEYILSAKEYTNIIFQSITSVDFFKDYEILKDKNIFCMGKATQSYLAKKNIKSICPNLPGSEELKRVLLKNKNDGNYLIVKGEKGLNEIFNYLNSSGKNVEEVICYKRIKYDCYDHIKRDFIGADAIIFPSTFAFDIFFEEIYSGRTKAKLFGISDRINAHIASFGLSSYLVDYFSDDIVESIKKTT